MENVSVSVFIASSYDEKEYSIDNIVNEFDYDENGNNLAIISIINGYRDGENLLEFDYFIRKIGDDEDGEGSKNKFLYLFSTELATNKVSFDEGEKELPSSYPNWFFSIGGENVRIEFQGRGNYELEVFKLTNTEERNASERYKEYRESNISPVGLYCFKLK